MTGLYKIILYSYLWICAGRCRAGGAPLHVPAVYLPATLCCRHRYAG